MATYEIRYGLTGGFGGCGAWEEIDFEAVFYSINY